MKPKTIVKKTTKKTTPKPKMKYGGKTVKKK